MISHRHGAVSRSFFLLVALAAATIVYTAAFKVMTTLGLGTYRLAQELMSAEAPSFLVGAGYLGIFEFWNHILPLALGAAMKTAVLASVAMSIFVLILAAALSDFMRDKARMANWGIAIACLPASFQSPRPGAIHVSTWRSRLSRH